MLSRKTFAAGIALLASVYEKLERITSDKFLSEQWYKMLSDLTDAQFKYAIEVIVKTQKFAPTISEIREKAVEYNHQSDLTPEEAWAIVYTDIHAKGYYNEPHYEDWKLEAAKNAIGWQTLCDMTEDSKSPGASGTVASCPRKTNSWARATWIISPSSRAVVSVTGFPL